LSTRLHGRALADSLGVVATPARTPLHRKETVLSIPRLALGLVVSAAFAAAPANAAKPRPAPKKASAEIVQEALRPKTGTPYSAYLESELWRNREERLARLQRKHETAKKLAEAIALQKSRLDAIEDSMHCRQDRGAMAAIGSCGDDKASLSAVHGAQEALRRLQDQAGQLVAEESSDLAAQAAASDERRELESAAMPLCQAAPGAAPAPDDLRPPADVSDYSPGWARFVPANIAALACGSDAGCFPAVFRNDLVPNAEYRARTIRFSWPFFEREAQRLQLEVGSLEFVYLLAGVLAHEYGHFLEVRYYDARPADALCAAIPGCEQSFKAWRRELWADSVAGCVLGRLQAPDSHLKRSLEALSTVGSATHPDAKMRAEAVSLGWQRCASAEVPSLVREVFLKQSPTEATNATGGNRP
jgi:hypothetical protein